MALTPCAVALSGEVGAGQQKPEREWGSLRSTAREPAGMGWGHADETREWCGGRALAARDWERLRLRGGIRGGCLWPLVAARVAPAPVALDPHPTAHTRARAKALQVASPSPSPRQPPPLLISLSYHRAPRLHRLRASTLLLVSIWNLSETRPTLAE